MSSKAKLLSGGAALLVLALVAGAGVWYFMIRSDAPPEVSLEAAIEAAGSQGGSSANNGSPAGQPSSSDNSLAGVWNIAPGTNSFVGYRVREELVGVGSATAVGRTSSITGRLQYDGRNITSVEVTADLRTLASDRPQRDGQLRTQALETNRYPEATFVLASPIAIDSVPPEGQTVTHTAQGKLTLHGVTRDIQLQVQGAIQNGRLVVVGSTEIVFADYNIAQPRAASVLSVENRGTLELQLIFEKGA